MKKLLIMLIATILIASGCSSNNIHEDFKSNVEDKGYTLEEDNKGQVVTQITKNTTIGITDDEELMYYNKGNDSLVVFLKKDGSLKTVNDISKYECNIADNTCNQGGSEGYELLSKAFTYIDIDIEDYGY